MRFDADGTSLKRADVQRWTLTHTNCGPTQGSGRHGSQNATKRLRLTERQSSSAFSAIPTQVEKPVSSILQHGTTRRDCWSDAAADAAKKARTRRMLHAVETLRTMALNSANITLQRTPSEEGSESDVVAKASELRSLKDKMVCAEVYGHNVDHKLISSKWMLKRLGDETSSRVPH